MIFTSFNFISFLLLVIVLYWTLPHKFRWILLLGASYLFYMSWEPAYILLILISTATDYFLCRFLTSKSEARKRKAGLILNISLNLVLLFVFKYYNFFQDTLDGLAQLFGGNYAPRYSSFLLPVGISFYTFQTLSYSFDVYRKKILPEKHFGKFALFVAYFPQLVAGPIERASDLLTQFKERVTFKITMLQEGAVLFLWGLFKKAVVADNLKILADHVFDNADFQNGGSIIFALFAFTIQIYADFSGYSDMAIGVSKMMGIDLSINFKTPYFSRSISEFWRRWHITLSFWLRDYVFIPLGGSRAQKWKIYRNLFLVFLLAGIWHGADWTFVIWGAVHGLLVIIERVFGWHKSPSNSIWNFLKWGFTFAIIILTMLPVRAEDFEHLFNLGGQILQTNTHELYLGFAENVFTPGIFGLIILFLVDWFVAKKSILDIRMKHWTVQLSWSVFIIISIILLGDAKAEAFFYFQF